MMAKFWVELVFLFLGAASAALTKLGVLPEGLGYALMASLVLAGLVSLRIQQYVSGASRVASALEEICDPELRQMGHSEVERTLHKLGQLAQGSVEIDTRHAARSKGLDILAAATEGDSILATQDLVAHPNALLAPRVNEFHTTNERAVAAGASVKRVMLVNDPDRLSDQELQFVACQQQVGVQTCTVQKSLVASEHEADFICKLGSDGKTYSLIGSRAPDVRYLARYSTTQADFEDCKRRFELLRTHEITP